MVTKLGMSEKIGLTSLKDDEYKVYSDKTNEDIDEEIEKIVQEALQLARSILIREKDKLIKFQKELLEKESLSHDEIIEILGPRSFDSNENYQNYLKETRGSNL